MPIDLRKIIFSNEEVQAALVNHCIRHKINMPRTAISRVSIHWETELTSNIHFASHDDSEEENVLTFSNEEVAAALILYCQVHNDPLPRDAQKILDPAGDGVSLTLRRTWGDTVNKDHPGFSIPWLSEDADTKDVGEEKTEVD